MTKHLATTTILTLLVLAQAAAPMANAASGSLLSGYGGPGQGSQAILGSALLNGPSGGSPGAGPATTAGTATSAHVSSSRGVSHTARTGASRTTSGGGSSAGAARAYPASDEAITSRARTDDSSSLGLSGADLLYLLLALGALALTAMLTRGFARSGRDGKAHG